jgi:hypothetical protein
VAFFSQMRAQADQKRHGHADTGQVLQAGWTIRALRVDCRYGWREAACHLVMIRDHHVDTYAIGMLDRIMAAGATIRRYYQGDASDDRYPIDMLRLYTVTFVDSVRQVKGDIRTGLFQKIVQECGGSDAIHIVVSENKYLFMSGDGPCDAFHGRTHAFQGAGRAQLVQSGSHKCPCVFGSDQLAIHQKRSHNWRTIQRFAEVFDKTVVWLAYAPFFFHRAAYNICQPLRTTPNIL